MKQAYLKSNTRPLEKRYAPKPKRKERRTRLGPPSGPLTRRKARAVIREPQSWSVTRDATRLEFVGDSLLVVNALRGVWKMNYRPYAARVDGILTALHNLEGSTMLPREDYANLHRHVYRELNAVADRVAAKARDGSSTFQLTSLPADPRCVRVYFDGGRQDGRCTAGWVAYASTDPGAEDDSWQEVAWSSFPVHAASSVAAELEAAAGAHSFVVAWLSGQDVEKAVREHLAWQYMA